MHIALKVFGYGALVLIALTAYFYKLADRPGDDFGAVVPVYSFGMLTAIFVAVWIALMIYKAVA